MRKGKIREKIRETLKNAKEKALNPLGFKAFFWQRVKDSNPHIQSQSLLCYHYTNPLHLSAVANRYYYTRNELFVNRFFEFFSNFFIYSISPSNEAAPS